MSARSENGESARCAWRYEPIDTSRPVFYGSWTVPAPGTETKETP